jgi:hypothetical protein
MFSDDNKFHDYNIIELCRVFFIMQSIVKVIERQYTIKIEQKF